ncbi:MAG TPA: dihydrolipoamide acetyltransferase family protein [Burkholderiales bacterium]|nr:dihydrolipoamide acetyltransferase family protein [Burkholderiales bacterium]
MIEFKLPSLGADMDEGKLLQWKVKPGDKVKRGDVVAVVDTSKAAVEVEIWQDGTVHQLIVEPGTKVPVGAVLALLLAPGESAAAVPAAAVPAVAVPAKAEARKPVSPAARKRAGELGVDVEKVRGTGAQGAVTVEDVEKAAAPAAAAPDRAAEMRKAIGAAMSRSKREIPHYYLSQTIPMLRATEWLARENEKRPVTARILMAVLQLKAVALALKKFPDLNGFWRDGAYRPSSAVHVGVAISLREGGLIAPAIHDVPEKPLDELMKDLSDLVKRARAGSLRSSEMSDPTITVSNLGEGGVESTFAIIYPPQVAIVGFGRIASRPWAEGEALRALPTVIASLSADHRASDGHRGALFLAELARFLQEPEKL